MPVNHAAAVYATKSKLLLRIVIPDLDDKEIDNHLMRDGESLIRIPIDQFRKQSQADIQAAIGQPTFSGICAVVDKNTNLVIARIIADPELYSDPDGHFVIPSDDAMHGDKWTGKEFTREYAEIDDDTGKILAIRTVLIAAVNPQIKTTNYMVPASTLVTPKVGDEVRTIVNKIALVKSIREL